MKAAFEITDPLLIADILDHAAYGTLALCRDNRPYSLPLNFVHMNDAIYFHGSQKGRKMEMLQQNPYASFSVVEPYALIASYFSSDEGLACPATHFFKSIIMDGTIAFVTDYDEKAAALEALMQKLQPEGGYAPLNDAAYGKMIDATALYKLLPETTRAKFKFGQHLNAERFEKIISHLQQRGSDIDLSTIELMRAFHPDTTSS